MLAQTRRQRVQHLEKRDSKGAVEMRGLFIVVVAKRFTFFIIVV